MHFRDNQLPYHHQVLDFLWKNDFASLDDFLRTHIEFLTPDGLLQNPMLHLACRYNSNSMVKLIHAQLGDNIKLLAKKRVAEGWTPLHLAAIYGDADLMQTLLDILGDEAPQTIMLPIADNTQATALHLAVSEGKTAVVAMLLKAAGKQVNQIAQLLLADEWPLLHLIVHCGDYPMLNTLMQVVAHEHLKKMAAVYLKSGMNILHLAAISGDQDIAEQVLYLADDLIYELAQAKVAELENATPLNLAVQYGLTNMVKKILIDLKELAKPLCQKLMASGWNAFTQVAYFGNVEMLQAMLDVLGEDAEKMITQPFSLIKNATPFHMVINRGNVAMTKAMLNAVDSRRHRLLLNLEQNDGVKPIHLAKRFYNDDLLNVLLDTGVAAA